MSLIHILLHLINVGFRLKDRTYYICKHNISDDLTFVNDGIPKLIFSDNLSRNQKKCNLCWKLNFPMTS